MATYLKSLPATEVPVQERSGERAGEPLLAERRHLHDAHCVDCHGADGKGLACPPLAANRAVTLSPSVNTFSIVLNSGFPPGTAGNPRPYGRLPFSHALNDAGGCGADLCAPAGAMRVRPASVQNVNRNRSVPLYWNLSYSHNRLHY